MENSYVQIPVAKRAKCFLSKLFFTTPESHLRLVSEIGGTPIKNSMAPYTNGDIVLSNQSGHGSVNFTRSRQKDCS